MTARPSAGADQTVRSSSVASFPSVRPLSDLLADLPTHEVHGDPSTLVQALCYRSDEAAPGSLFFCVPGEHVDGHDFADDAVARGAAVVVVERRLPSPAVQVVVPSVRAAMGPMSAAFFGRPADRMTVVGITGTNGMSRSSFLRVAIFGAAGWTTGVIGPTGIRILVF
jgi:UDP-N-acetylmuramoyl-L-alanyl-D-glutamate--2,6-diaminopimelate ligase